MKIPKQSLSLLVLVCVLAEAVAAQGPTKIAESGNTVLNATANGHTASVTIKSDRVAASSPCASAWLRRTIPDYGAKEVTSIEDLEISLDGSSLFVPPSTYLTIFDAKKMSVSYQKGSFVIKIVAGDGAYAAFSLIYFNKSGINRSSVYDFSSPKHPVEDTQYLHLVTP